MEEEDPIVTTIEADEVPYAPDVVVQEVVQRLTEALADDALIDSQIGRMATSWKEPVNLGPHLLKLLIRQHFVLTIIYNPDPESQVISRLLFIPCRDPVVFEFYVALCDLRSSMRRMLVRLATGRRWREVSDDSGAVRSVPVTEDGSKQRERSPMRAFESIEIDDYGTYISRRFIGQVLFSERFKSVCLEPWKTAASITFLMERLFLSIMDPLVMFRTAFSWLQRCSTANVHAMLDHILRTRFEFSFDSRGTIGLLNECPLMCINDECMSKTGKDCFVEIRLTGPVMFQCNTVSNKYNCNVAYKHFRFPRMFDGVMNPWRVGMLKNVCNTLMLVSYSYGHRSVMIMYIYRQVMEIMCRLWTDTLALKRHVHASQIARNSDLVRSLEAFAEFLQESARLETSALDLDVQQMCVAIGVRTAAVHTTATATGNPVNLDVP